MKIARLVIGLSSLTLFGTAHACYDSFVGTENEQTFSRASPQTQVESTTSTSVSPNSSAQSSLVMNAVSTQPSTPRSGTSPSSSAQ